MTRRAWSPRETGSGIRQTNFSSHWKGPGGVRSESGSLSLSKDWSFLFTATGVGCPTSLLKLSGSTNPTSHMGPWTRPVLSGSHSLGPLLSSRVSAQFSTHLPECWEGLPPSSPPPPLSPASVLPQTPTLRAGQSPGKVAFPWPLQPLAAPPAVALSSPHPHSCRPGSCPCSCSPVTPT